MIGFPYRQVVSVGGSSFSECPLKNFAVCSTSCFLDVVGCVLVSKDVRVCYCCIIGKVEEVVIPDTVEEISDNVFIIPAAFQVLEFVILLH